MSGNLLITLEGHTGEVRNVVFSPNGHLVMTCDQHGWVFLWKANGTEIGCLLGSYVATYEVGAVYWQNRTQMVLADLGGTRFRPHFYQLSLEGME